MHTIGNIKGGLEIFGLGQQKGKTMEQLKLPLTFYPFKEYLGGFKRIRKALAKKVPPLKAWRQLPLKLYVKTIFQVKTGFYWTRPDGRQFFCKTVRQLVARVMDYDGHMLMATLRKLK